MMKNKSIFWIFGIMFLVSLISVNVLATDVLVCPATILLSDTYDVVNNLSETVAGTACITLRANNVMFDCHGFNISSDDFGFVLDTSDNNVTIKNCNIRAVTNAINVAINGNPINIYNNTLNTTASNTIYVQSPSTTNITNNTIHVRATNGIFFDAGGPSFSNITRNVINVTGGATGIKLNQGANAGVNVTDTIIYVNNTGTFHFSNSNAFNLKNITYMTNYGYINFYGSLFNYIADKTLDTTRLNISPNKAFVNSAFISSLNRTASINLLGLNATTHFATYDLEDDNTYSLCNSGTDPQCNITSDVAGVLTFNVSHFTTFSSNETTNTAPFVSLFFPANDTIFSDFPQSNGSFIFYPYDAEDASTSCDLKINGTIVGTNTSSLNGTATTINHSFTYSDNGYGLWNVTCTDSGALSNTSGIRNFTVQIPNPFSITIVNPPAYNQFNRTYVDLNFSFLATHTVDTSFSCLLDVGGFEADSNITVLNNTMTSFLETLYFGDQPNGVYDWKINCTDSFTISESSATNQINLTLIGDSNSNITIGNISSLEIWDSGDVEGGNWTIHENQWVAFYANYINLRSGTQTQYNYNLQCFPLESTTASTFYKSSTWLFRLFITYIVLYFTYLAYQWVVSLKNHM